MTTAIPKHLYKYKSFSVDSLDLLVSDSLYFADPVSFNDPLDCNPSVKNNINNVGILESILFTLCTDNQQKELEKAAAKIKYNGPRTIEKIASLGRSEAARLIDRITVTTNSFDESYIDELIYHIKRYLLKNYKNGVLSLAKNNNCPLMWSHYADQHKGFCIGYDVSVDHFENIYPVNYEGKRFITTQQINNMLFGEDDGEKTVAKKQIDDVVLLSKAPTWSYEKEFRVINSKGLQNSPFNLTDVTFGLRFKESAKYSVMRALSERKTKVKFYEMTICDDSFTMNRKEISLGDENIIQYPVDHYATIQKFEDVS